MLSIFLTKEVHLLINMYRNIAVGKLLACYSTQSLYTVMLVSRRLLHGLSLCLFPTILVAFLFLRLLPSTLLRLFCILIVDVVVLVLSCLVVSAVFDFTHSSIPDSLQVLLLVDYMFDCNSDFYCHTFDVPDTLLVRLLLPYV